MELVNNSVALREDRNLLVITHLSQYLDFITGFGGLLVPLVIWLTTKDSVVGMEEHGKSVINFQLTLILSIVMPVVNAVKASNGESPSYFGTIRFIS